MATVQQCGYCFDALVESLTGSIPTPIISLGDSASQEYPLFVTWKKKSSNSNEWRLRGCIGTFSSKSLGKGLKEFSLISALRDSRFSPINQSEISQLRVEVSLLVNFEQAADYSDWIVGKHGIQIEFSDSSSVGRSATYLPDVAKEQGWTIEETIAELVQKAGYRGALTQRLKSSIKLTRYQSSKASLTYAEYLQLKRENLNGRISTAPIVSVGEVGEISATEISASIRTSDGNSESMKSKKLIFKPGEINGKIQNRKRNAEDEKYENEE